VRGPLHAIVHAAVRRIHFRISALRLILILPGIWADLAACGGGRSHDQPRGNESQLPPAPTFDLDEVVGRVGRAYRVQGDGTIEGHNHNFSVSAMRSGVQIVPRSTELASPDGLGHPRLEGAPLTIETVAILRGGTALGLGTGAIALGGDGTLRIDRGVAEEALENHPDDVEQSWTFESEPGVSGDLELHVRFDGQEYVGRDDNGLHFVDMYTGMGVLYGPATWIDATGARTTVSAAFEDGEIVLALSDSVVSTSAYPAMLDPTISAEFGLTNPAIGPSPFTEEAPKIAFDGTTSLVVWADTRDGSLTRDIYGTRINASGTPLDGTGIEIAIAPNDQTQPAVAYDGAQYLVVWADRRSGTSFDLYGQRVSTAGALVGPQIAISLAAGDQQNPRVAAFGGAWIVAWQDHRSGVDNVYFARISGAGAVLDASGVAVAAGANAQSLPSIACGSANCIIAWQHASTTSIDARASRLNPTTGALIDAAPLALKTGQGPNLYLDVAWDGTDYLAVWQTYQLGAFDIQGNRVNASTGAILDGSGFFINQSIGQQQAPKVAFNGTQYLVTWEDSRAQAASGFDVYSTLVNTNGTVVSPAGVAVNTGANNQLFPAVVAAAGGTFWVVYQSEVMGPYLLDIYVSQVTAAGTVPNPAGTELSQSANRQARPAVVALTTGTYLAVWTDSVGTDGQNYDIIGARIDTSGTVLDPSGIVICNAAGRQVAPQISRSATGRMHLIVWQDARSGTGYDIYGARFNPNSGLLDPNGFAISTAAGDQTFPSAASYSNNGFLVAWGDERNGRNNRDIYGARIMGRNVMDAAGFVIVGAAGDQSQPTVATGGGTNLVAWTDARTGVGTENILAAQVTIANPPVVGTPIVVSAVGNQQQYVHAAFNGTNFFLVWSDTRAGVANSDIYGARVSTAFTLLDPNGIGLATTVVNETYPGITEIGVDVLVGWRRQHAAGSNDYDVVIQRFDGAGVAVDPAPLLLNSSTDNRDAPSLAAASNTNAIAVYRRFVVDVGLAMERVRAEMITFP
jgi:hypothetical protein